VGEVALQLGEPLAARDSFREAAGRQWRPLPQVALYRAWGQAALSAGLADEAALAFEAALRREPADIDTRLMRAQALAISGHKTEALGEARRALEQAPNDEHAAALVDELGRP
jgi:tetratricopeptide (TPR) repeat protein